MTDSSAQQRKVTTLMSYAAAVALGVAAEFLAESLKFMAGAALRSLQMLVELFTYRPAHESWAFIQDMALICVVLAVLIYASKWVANWTRSILHHRNETAFLIVSILIAGLILEEVDQHKYQREWEEKHRVELGLPANQPSVPSTPRSAVDHAN